MKNIFVVIVVSIFLSNTAADTFEKGLYKFEDRVKKFNYFKAETEIALFQHAAIYRLTKKMNSSENKTLLNKSMDEKTNLSFAVNPDTLEILEIRLVPNRK